MVPDMLLIIGMQETLRVSDNSSSSRAERPGEAATLSQLGRGRGEGREAKQSYGGSDPVGRENTTARVWGVTKASLPWKQKQARMKDSHAVGCAVTWMPTINKLGRLPPCNRPSQEGGRKEQGSSFLPPSSAPFLSGPSG